MNAVWRYAFRFSSNNNTRSNAGIMFVGVMILLYWLTCTGESNADVVSDYRDVWKASELCDHCTSGWEFISVPWCGVIGWIATWGLFIAICYWFFARRDEAMRVIEGAWEKTLIDRGGVQDLPDQPPAPTAGAAIANTPLQRMQRRGFNMWQLLRWDFISNVISDLATSLVFHRV